MTRGAMRSEFGLRLPWLAPISWGRSDYQPSTRQVWNGGDMTPCWRAYEATRRFEDILKDEQGRIGTGKSPASDL